MLSQMGPVWLRPKELLDHRERVLVVMLTYSAMFILTISAHHRSAPVAVSRLPKPIYTGYHTLLSAEPSFFARRLHGG